MQFIAPKGCSCTDADADADASLLTALQAFEGCRGYLALADLFAGLLGRSRDLAEDLAGAGAAPETANTDAAIARLEAQIALMRGEKCCGKKRSNHD